MKKNNAEKIAKSVKYCLTFLKNDRELAPLSEEQWNKLNQEDKKNLCFFIEEKIFKDAKINYVCRNLGYLISSKDFKTLTKRFIWDCDPLLSELIKKIENEFSYDLLNCNNPCSSYEKKGVDVNFLMKLETFIQQNLNYKDFMFMINDELMEIETLPDFIDIIVQKVLSGSANE